MKDDHATVVPAVYQKVVDNNAAAPVASSKSGIDHTSTPDTAGPAPTITEDVLN